ncbi:coiled-coil domain-containing protein, partial [Streptomyces sp. 12297]
MSTHRRPRTGLRMNAQALGVTSAALASVSLLAPQGAVAVPRPRPALEDIRAQVDELYRQAGAATQRYDAVKERAAEQRAALSRLMAQVARNTAKLNEARRMLGSYAAAQYRGGGVGDTATLLLADDPQSYFGQRHLLSRLGGQQQDTLTAFRSRQADTARERRAAAAGVAA